MSIVAAVFTQLIDKSKPPQKLSVKVSKETNSKKNIQTFVEWASKQLVNSMGNANKHNSKKFDLRKPIFADIFWDGKLKLKLVQIKVTKDSSIGTKNYPYKIGLSTYSLVPRMYYRQPEKQRKVAKKKNGLRNPDKYISATNAQVGAEKKLSSPVIYTGWTK